MKLCNALFTVTALALTLGSSQAQAKIVCWKDNEGVRSCGSAIPPEYAQQSSKRLNKQGVTIERTTRAKTAEELKAEREERRKLAEKEREERIIANEQARKDLVLLQTYNSEDELELARDGKIAVIDSRIKHNVQAIKKLQTSLKELQDEAAALERSGKKVPEKLSKEINGIQNRIQERKKVNEQFTQDQDEVREVFAADIARYRELKGK